MQSKCILILLALLLISASSFAVTENECLNLTKSALLQIHGQHNDPLLPPDLRNWNGTFVEGGHRPSGEKTIGVGNTYFFCRGGLKANGVEAAAATGTEGNLTMVGINRNSLSRIEDYKAVIFHEMMHAGVAVQVNKTALSALNIFSGSCDETLAHAKTLILLQSLDASSPEFGGRNISKSKSWTESMRLLEIYLYECMQVNAKSDEEIDNFLKKRQFNLVPADQARAKQEYKRIMGILRTELSRVKRQIMEKKIVHMRSDGRISPSENRTLESIRAWLNITPEDYRTIYDGIAMADIPPRCEGPLPASAAGPLSDGMMLAVATEPGGRLEIGLAPEGGELKLREGLRTGNTVEVGEGTLTGILESFDRTEAIRVALASGEIKVAGNYGLPAALYAGSLRMQYSFSPPPFSPGTMLRIGSISAPIERSAHGLAFATLPNTAYSLVLNRYGGITGCTTPGAMRLASYMPGQLTPSAGVYIPEWDPQTHRSILNNWPPSIGSQGLACSGGIHAPEETGAMFGQSLLG